MTPRRHAAILTMIAAVGLVALVWVTLARAAEPEFDPEAIVVKCPDETCSLSKKDLGAFAREFLKMSKELKLLRNKRCLSNMTTT